MGFIHNTQKIEMKIRIMPLKSKNPNHPNSETKPKIRSIPWKPEVGVHIAAPPRTVACLPVERRGDDAGRPGGRNGRLHDSAIELLSDQVHETRTRRQMGTWV
ncbi:hypothetical protein ACS0TY_030841 [Phlomoides rotata]